MADFKQTSVYNFSKFCKNFEKFSVPRFQRPYAWTNKNVQDFWYSIISNENNYFIGNIVAVDGDPLLIVDGQQRLTTISLLLIALRDIYQNLDVKSSDKEVVKRSVDRITRYLEDDDLGKPFEDKYRRLILGKDSYQDVYNSMVSGTFDEDKIKILGDSQKRYFNNYKILTKLIKDYIKGSELERMNEILSKTLDLQFIVIICATDNDIYRIFEGFNSTGLGLSVADLVKNALLRGGEVNKEIQTEMEESWNELEEFFERTSISKFPKFLRYQWISYYGYIQMSSLYKEINNKKIEDRKPEEILKYVNQVLYDGKSFLGMIYKEHEKFLDLDDELISIIKKFRFLKNEQVYEVLLSYYRLYNNKKIKKSVYKKIINRLWIFVARARFVSINPSDYEKIFAQHCKDLTEDDSLKENDIPRLADSFFSKLKKLVSAKEQFKSNLISDVRYGKDNKLITEIFKNIMALEQPSIQMREPEIEHILPQDPKKWGLEKTDIKDYVNDLGNLTLLFSKDNKNVGNEIMLEKIKVFSNSDFSLNKEIANKWSKDFESNFKKAINKRSEEIADRIEGIWRL